MFVQKPRTIVAIIKKSLLLFGSLQELERFPAFHPFVDRIVFSGNVAFKYILRIGIVIANSCINGSIFSEMPYFFSYSNNLVYIVLFCLFRRVVCDTVSTPHNKIRIYLSLDKLKHLVNCVFWHVA